MKKFLTFILVLVAVLSVSSIALAADAATINGTGYATLKAALEAAKDGDTINIAADTHKLGQWESRITGKSITLIGAGKDQTFIESEKYGFVLQGHPDKPITYTLKNMTIKSGCCTGIGHDKSKCEGAQPLYVKGNTTVYLEDVTLHNAGTGTTAILVDSANGVGDPIVYEPGITATVNATNVTVDAGDKILLLANPSTEGRKDILSYAKFNYDSNCTDIVEANCIPQPGKNFGGDNLLVNNKIINPAVAQIGTTKYGTLQAAINAVKNTTGNHTITFLTDIKESVVVEQNEGVNITIDGAGFKMKNPTGKGKSIEIDGNSRATATETLKITNIVFDISELTGEWDAIYQDSAADGVRYPHNVTIDNCDFNFAKGETGVAVKIRQGYNITISGCEMNGGHSLFQCISCQGATIENTEVYGASEGGVNINNSTGVTVSGCTFECDLYGVRGGAEYDAKGGVTIKGTTIKAEKPIIMRYMTAKADYTLNIENEENALTPHWDNTTEPTYDEKAPIYVTEGEVSPSKVDAYKKDNLKQDGSIAAWNKDTNTYYTGWRAAIADAKPGETVYPVKNGGLDVAGAVTIPKPSTGSGISVTYNGGNSFSTSKSDVPTGVEIDNVPVSFTGNGSNFTVSGIPAGAKWITVRWNSTSVTTNFTPNGAYFAEVEIPKTGDMSFWAAIAEFLGF